MNTPIYDFVQEYVQKNPLRLHMPGHKGISVIGCEPYDITEIDGADSLYDADGIIRQSEDNASALFGADTIYSTEGSSLCIRAMLYLALLSRHDAMTRPVIYAGRNAHKTFVSAAALLDFDINWIENSGGEGYLSCAIDTAKLDAMLSQSEQKPVAVYITSPDYLGNMSDIKAISAVCRRYGVMLIVDNAHGAYLKFLPRSEHPIDLGADICCDSAHKTLPVLTGGAYLHISKNAPSICADMAKTALGLFGSTSPSYLILQSLDIANRYIADSYREKLATFLPKAEQLKARLKDSGYSLTGDEALKLTISSKAYGYTGTELADELGSRGIVCEFADNDYTVMMLTPDTATESIYTAMRDIPQKEPITVLPPPMPAASQVMTVREAIMSRSELLPIDECCGRVVASPNVGCPPAVPIVVCGERIDGKAIECFKYYGIEKCMVAEI